MKAKNGILIPILYYTPLMMQWWETKNSSLHPDLSRGLPGESGESDQSWQRYCITGPFEWFRKTIMITNETVCKERLLTEIQPTLKKIL